MIKNGECLLLSIGISLKIAIFGVLRSDYLNSIYGKYLFENKKGLENLIKIDASKNF